MLPLARFQTPFELPLGGTGRVVALGLPGQQDILLEAGAEHQGNQGEGRFLPVLLGRILAQTKLNFLADFEIAPDRKPRAER